jgi:hypothetical protein
MSHSLFFFTLTGVITLGVGFGLRACGDDDDVSPTAAMSDATAPRSDSSKLVDPSEAGNFLDSGYGAAANCSKYCSLVMKNCTGPNAQYATFEECEAFCSHLPLNQPSREADEKEAASVACRQYWADSPSITNPAQFCLAAGPYGGNACGDRCTAFCDVLLDTCTPDGGTPAYASGPDCAYACANFTYRDAGTDGGGEGPGNPGTADSLNCRLYQLRQVVKNPQKCMTLHPDGGLCETDNK